MLRALIFDFDGTIANTEAAVHQSVAEIFDDHGAVLSTDLWRDLIGTVNSDTVWIDWLEAQVGPVRGDELMARAQLRNRELVAMLSPLPGVAEIIGQAHAAGLGLAVASSSPHAWVDPNLAQLGLAEYFRVVRCRDDVAHPKPAPDLVIAALHGLGVPAESAVMIEDSAHGAAAARVAGVSCVVVPHHLTAASDFGPGVRIVDSLAHVTLAELALLVP